MVVSIVVVSASRVVISSAVVVVPSVVVVGYVVAMTVVVPSTVVVITVLAEHITLLQTQDSANILFFFIPLCRSINDLQSI